jgi:large subunit ribosomal protein L17
MHRHGYKGRKFGRERDQRSALLKQLVSSLIERGKIETTLPKAKEIVPIIEKLITKAKQGDLAGRRQVIAGVTTLSLAFKLVDEIAPQLTKRSSGHVRLSKTRLRRGDNAEMAEVSFVDTLTVTAPATTVRARTKAPTVTKKGEANAKPTLKATRSAAPVKQATVAPKRTGRRGDR